MLRFTRLLSSQLTSLPWQPQLSLPVSPAQTGFPHVAEQPERAQAPEPCALYEHRRNTFSVAKTVFEVLDEPVPFTAAFEPL